MRLACLTKAGSKVTKSGDKGRATMAERMMQCVGEVPALGHFPRRGNHCRMLADHHVFERGKLR